MYIKEFWEFSKSLYGQSKWVKDSINDLTNFNSQNGYSNEGQWTITTMGEIFIQEINSEGFSGIDKDGNKVNGKTSDIIRTMTKKEVLKEF